MTWTQPADLRQQVQRLWERGVLLRAAVDTATLAWPLRLTLKTPSPSDLADRFNEVRDWIGALEVLPQVRLQWRERTHRVLGRQRLPEAAFVDDLVSALAFIGKTRSAAAFTALWRRIADEQPALLPWLLRRPLMALDLDADWPRLLAIVAWLKEHPRPGCYLRQVDVPGVDSKFIEAHRGALAALFDLTLPATAIDASASGTGGFARRYGFRDKPLRIRFRLLDPELPSLPGCSGLVDLTLDATSFASLALPIERAFITENEINFLALPPVPRAIVCFGAGYGWEALTAAHWLRRCRLYYWGDLDTHGFAILDQLRMPFPDAMSWLMDRETLLAHRAHWGEEQEPVRRDLPRLTREEAAVYDDLRLDRLQPSLRLEQERISFGWLTERLARL